jgi:hypothetical protein
MAVINYYTIEDELIGERIESARTNYLVDALGSITGLVTSDQLVSSCKYKPFGEALEIDEGASLSRYLWLGSSGVASTGLSHADVDAFSQTYDSLSGNWLPSTSMWTFGATNSESNPTTRYTNFGIGLLDPPKVNPPRVNPPRVIPPRVNPGFSPKNDPLPKPNPGSPWWGLVKSVVKGTLIIEFILQANPAGDPNECTMFIDGQIHQARHRRKKLKRIVETPQERNRRNIRAKKVMKRSRNGNCTKKRYDWLLKQKNRICGKAESLGTCTPKMEHDLTKLLPRIDAWQECASIRLAIMNECFEGGDNGHVRTYNSIMDLLDKCYKLMPLPL